MRLPAVIVLAWVLLALDHGLRTLLMFGESGPRPSFIFALVVAIGLTASAPAATWAALLLGVAVDLLDQATTKSGQPRTILGPNALGYLIAMQFILAMRPLMNKRNPLSFGFLGLTGSAVAGVVVIILFSLRTIYNDPIVWGSKRSLIVMLGSSVYTGVLATFLSLALIPLSGFLGVQQQGRKR